MKKGFVVFILFCCANLFASKINIMSYNVENLFDPTYETEQKDWTLCPIHTPINKSIVKLKTTVQHNV